MIIYLDNNATTPVYPRVAEAIECRLRGGGGNPSSDHAAGREAAAAVYEARARLALLLGCDADEIVFTGCGSESNNLALKGAAYAHHYFLDPDGAPYATSSLHVHPFSRCHGWPRGFGAGRHCDGSPRWASSY